MMRPNGNRKPRVAKKRLALLIGALAATTLLIAFLPQEERDASLLGGLRTWMRSEACLTFPWIRNASAGEILHETPAAEKPARDDSQKSGWWEDDIWRDPDRPFHYYGEAKDRRPKKVKEAKEPKDEEPVKKTEDKEQAPEEKTLTVEIVDINDFSRFTTLESLKAEREKRLSVAIMNPTPENMASYQAINAHVLSLSARFAEAWQLSRMAEPQYDFTAVNPSAAFAVTARTEMKKEDRQRLIQSLSGNAGLVFVGDPAEPLTEIAAGPVAAFAEMHGLDVMAIAAKTKTDESTSDTASDGKPVWPKAGTEVAGFGAFKAVLPDDGRTDRWGIRMLPALLLVPSPDAMATRSDFRRLKGGLAGRDGFILATGAVSGEEISRRLALLLGPDTLMTGKPAALDGHRVEQETAEAEAEVLVAREAIRQADTGTAAFNELSERMK